MGDEPSGLDTRLAKALSHPLRRRLLMAYSDRVASPSQVAAELDEPLGDVSYHTKRLVEHGCIELVRAERGLGGLKHFYRAVVPYEVEDAQWAGLAPSLRRTIAEPVVSQILEDVVDAGATGAFEADDIHISRRRLDLDEPAWAELSALLRTVVDEAQRLNRESADRRGDAGGKRRSFLAVFHLPRKDPSAP